MLRPGWTSPAVSGASSTLRLVDIDLDYSSFPRTHPAPASSPANATKITRGSLVRSVGSAASGVFLSTIAPTRRRFAASVFPRFGLRPNGEDARIPHSAERAQRNARPQT